MVQRHLQDGFGDVPLQSCRGGCVSGWKQEQNSWLAALQGSCHGSSTMEGSQIQVVLQEERLRGLTLNCSMALTQAP